MTRIVRSATSLPHWLLLITLLTTGLSFGLAGCNSDDNGGTAPTIRHPGDFLPTSVSGWEADGEPQSGTTDAELSSSRVNGGYEIYTRHGMKEFAVAEYLGTGAQSGASLQIRIFEMTSAQGALDLYNDIENAPSNTEGNPEIGDVARLSNIPFVAGKRVDFVRDEYYVDVKVTGTSSDEEARVQAEFFAGNIDQEITQ